MKIEDFRTLLLIYMQIGQDLLVIEDELWVLCNTGGNLVCWKN